ncbi:MAG TPA: hypothetical protein DC000_13565 [Clostridiales bacterium]|nr:hypothetical protein [Clostridiales bacterium]
MLKEFINKNLIEKISQYRADGGKKNNLCKIIQEEVITDEPIKEVEIIGQDQVKSESQEIFIEQHEEVEQMVMKKIENKNHKDNKNKKRN